MKNYMKKFLDLIDYKINSTDRDGRTCYGENALILTAWPRGLDHSEINCIFDGDNQRIYELNLRDYINKAFYKYTDPIYRNALPNASEESEDQTQFKNTCDVESIDEFFTIASKIIKPMETIELNFEDEFLLKIALMAHEESMTLNEFVNYVLKEQIARGKF